MEKKKETRCQVIVWLVKSPAGNTLVLIPTTGARADLLALEVYVQGRAGTSEVELLTVADSVVRFDNYEADFISLNPVEEAERKE